MLEEQGEAVIKVGALACVPDAFGMQLADCELEVLAGWRSMKHCRLKPSCPHFFTNCRLPRHPPTAASPPYQQTAAQAAGSGKKKGRRKSGEGSAPVASTSELRLAGLLQVGVGLNGGCRWGYGLQLSC